MTRRLLLVAPLLGSLVLLSSAPANAGSNAGARARLYWQSGAGLGLDSQTSNDSFPQIVVTITGARSLRGADVKLAVVGFSGRTPEAWQVQPGGCAGDYGESRAGSFPGSLYPNAFTAAPSIPHMAQANNGMFEGAPDGSGLSAPGTSVLWLQQAGSSAAQRDSTVEYAVFSFRLDLRADSTRSCRGLYGDPLGTEGVAIYPAWCTFGGASSAVAGLVLVDEAAQKDTIYFDSGHDYLYWQTSLNSWPRQGAALCTNPSDQSEPVAAGVSLSATKKAVIVAWTDNRNVLSGTDIYAQMMWYNDSIPSGWPPNGRKVCGQVGNQSKSAIAPDGSGGAILAWRDDRNASTGADIYAQRISSSGMLQWRTTYDSAGVAATRAPSSQFDPVVIPDGLGGAIIGWQSTQSDTPFYATHILADGSLDSRWTPNGRPLSKVCPMPVKLHGKADGEGGAYFWWQSSLLSNGQRAVIRAQHIASDGSVVLGWPDSSLLVGPPPTGAFSVSQSNPSGDADANGLILAWGDARYSAGQTVFGQRVRSNGSRAWGVNGLGICTLIGSQLNPSLSVDGAGGAVVAWRRYGNERGGPVQATRLDSTGTPVPSWPVDGMVVCDSCGAFDGPVAIPDALGGAMIAWRDHRIGVTDTMICALHLGAQGGLYSEWPLSERQGAVVADTAWSPSSLEIATDNLNGAFVVWCDSRKKSPSDRDIYVQRVPGGGQVPPIVTAVGERGGRNSLCWIRTSPNPTRGKLSIRFGLGVAGPVKVDVVDFSGRRIRTLLDSPSVPAGTHSVEWNLRSSREGRPANGVYFVRAVSRGSMTARKIVLSN